MHHKGFADFGTTHSVREDTGIELVHSHVNARTAIVAAVVRRIRDGQVEIVRRREPELSAPDSRIHISLYLTVLPEDISVPRQARTGEPECRCVAQRHVDMSLDIQAIVFSAGQFHVGVELRLGFLRDVANRTAGIVAAEERALRPAQHLDPFHVHDAQYGARVARIVHLVDIEPDAAVEERRISKLPGATDGKCGDGIAGAERGTHTDVGNEIGDVFSVLESEPVEFQLIERRDGDGCLLQIEFAAFGGHDDLFQLLGGCRAGKELESGQKRQYDGEKSILFLEHSSIPPAETNEPLD